MQGSKEIPSTSTPLKDDTNANDTNANGTNEDLSTRTRTLTNEEEENEYTCCHRATFCNPILREIIVTNPISPCTPQITWSSLFWATNVIGFIVLSWCALFFLLGDEMLPGARIFGLFMLTIFSYILGWSFTYVPYLHLPPVFGMLLAGIIVRNADLYDIHEALGTTTSAKIRIFCLSFIMLRAGLNLNTTPLRQHPVFVLVLAVLPCTVEMVVVALCSRVILDYPWDWAFMNGTIIACMSPVVTVHCILSLAEQGYGEDKGMATLLCAAASIDDVHIVSIFSVFYSIVFSDDQKRNEWWAYIPGGLRDLLLGLIAGTVLGTFLAFVPHRKQKYVLYYRFGGLIVASLVCTTATLKLAVTGGGFLACVLTSFIATTGWRLLTVSFDISPLRKTSNVMWYFLQPLMVGVIGADIDFRDWTISRFGLYVGCILARSIFTVAATFRTPFNIKERIFVALAWLPKGTLQAALAPMAYEQASKTNDTKAIELAVDLVRISVVAIVFMAPLGAILMMLTGPILLGKATQEESQRERELSYLRIVSLQPVRQRKKKSKREAINDVEETI
ncbi:sodium/hydrogen exchanger 9B1 isoform X2 [Cephus cinctus]|uniref:Sodium/hydrogen exchanger 9B1 isoform X2 n=1 Tax=Cephus cinctus TaxID=211228 RepID=A0AAJ7FPI5_CEPCN|nr:sodium/hydrogen exchanger 9B1 isoform X2 [Cephus cinctus]